MINGHYWDPKKAENKNQIARRTRAFINIKCLGS